MKKDASLLASIDALPADEKALLVNHIWDSLYHPDKSIEESWVRESDRRWKAFRQGDMKGVSLEEFKKRHAR
jgi:putative addiction module component (TIGR02574 family)